VDPAVIHRAEPITRSVLFVGRAIFFAGSRAGADHAKRPRANPGPLGRTG